MTTTTTRCSHCMLISFDFRFQMSPASPSIEFDAKFSRLLTDKRRQKNESILTQKTLDSTTDVTENPMCHTADTEYEMHTLKGRPSLLENSMRISGDTSTDLDDGADDSFLAIERQCHLEEQRQRILEAEANNTVLSDIEPPSELWEDSLMAQPPVRQHLRNANDFVHMSPMRMVGVMRPSTIVEETSSQCNSTAENSQNSMNKKESESSLNTQSSTPSSVIYLSSSENSMVEKISPLKLVEANSSSECLVPKPFEARKKRETMVFTRRKYKFFKDENEQSTPLVVNVPPKVPATVTGDRISLDEPSLITFNTPNRDQFNDTIEAVEFFMERGKRLLEQTPQAKLGVNRTLLETPLFSCKRSRILSEMAATEMQPIPKRGPLLDLYSSPDLSPSTPKPRK